MERHKLPIADALPLGRLMASASLMASILRGDERVIMDMQTDASRFYAEAIAVGEVRGFVRRPLPEEVQRLTPGAATSPLNLKTPPGTLNMKLVLYERATPIESIVPVKNEGDVNEAMRAYFQKSEQIGHVVEFDAVANADNTAVEWSGGLIVNALPAAEGKLMQAAVEAVNARLQKMLPLHKALGEGARDLEDFLAELLELGAEARKTNMTPRTRIDFMCRCSSDALRDRLLTLPREDLQAMKEERVPELRCSYCNTAYTMKAEDFDWLLKQKDAKPPRKIGGKKSKAGS